MKVLFAGHGWGFGEGGEEKNFLEGEERKICAESPEQLPGVLTALVITILAGGIISFALLLLRVVNLRSGIPYGPFIALGGFVTMMWGQQIMTHFFFGA